MIPGIVLRPGQIITTQMGARYRLLAKQGDEWLCECDGELAERSAGFLRKHGVRLEFVCNERSGNV